MFEAKKIKLIFLLAGITFFAYMSSLGNPFIWDDEQFITSNSYVQQFQITKLFTQNTTAGAGVISNYYRPLTSLSFAIDAQIWAKNPLPYRLENILLHICAGILLFGLLGWLGMSEMPAFFISLFFLVFPTQVETVGYINSRGDSFFSFLFFASLISWLWGLKKKKTWPLWLSVILFALSILAKETALFGLPAYGIVLWLYLKKQEKTLKQFLCTSEKLFLLAITSISGIYFLLRMTVLNFRDTLNFYDGAQDIYSSHILVRIFTFCKILFIYIGLLIWPYPLHMERSVDYVTTAFSGWVIAALLFVSVLLILAVFVYKKFKNPWILFGFLWSTIFLIPVSGIVPISGLLYEHWLYLPMIGFWIMLYGIFQLILEKVPVHNEKRRGIRKLLVGLGITLVCIYSILTIRQNNIWADPVTFYTYTLQFAPTSARLHNNLGMSLAARQDNKGAIIEYKKALSLGEGYPQIYNNLGNAEIATGDYKNAEKNLLKALQLAPGFTVARENLLKLYLVSKQYTKARSLSQNNPQVEKLIQEMKGQ